MGAARLGASYKAVVVSFGRLAAASRKMGYFPLERLFSTASIALLGIAFTSSVEKEAGRLKRAFAPGVVEMVCSASSSSKGRIQTQVSSYTVGF